MIISPYREDARQIVILNPKGGCGKTTLATNLASHFAVRGHRPMLIDNDPKGYTTRWLEKRPQFNSRILGVSNGVQEIFRDPTYRPRIPKEIDTIIIDTPAALGQQEILRLTKNVDCILVPVLPSAFDIHVATTFIADLLVLTQFEKPVAVVANRTRKNTRSLATLMRILESFDTPTIAVLRDSQNYVCAASMGIGIDELPQSRAKKDIADFHNIIRWLEQRLSPTWEAVNIARVDTPQRTSLAAGSGIALPSPVTAIVR